MSLSRASPRRGVTYVPGLFCYLGTRFEPEIFVAVAVNDHVNVNDYVNVRPGD